MSTSGTLQRGDHAEITRGRFKGHRVIIGDVMDEKSGVLGVSGGQAEGWYPEHYLRKLTDEEIAQEATSEPLTDPRD